MNPEKVKTKCLVYSSGNVGDPASLACNYVSVILYLV